ncbi:MAG: hypothetical protein WCV00_24055 [Verrucomicrobiia bacterium]|jgi:hypothetical protein
MHDAQFRHNLAVCAAILLIQLLAMPWLNFLWFTVAVEGKTFPVVGGVSLLTLADIVPLASVFFIFGLLARRLFRSEHRSRWTIRCGVASGFLWLLTHQVHLAPCAADIEHGLNFYSQSVVPLIFSMIGYAVPHAFRRASTK